MVVMIGVCSLLPVMPGNPEAPTCDVPPFPAFKPAGRKIQWKGGKRALENLFRNLEIPQGRNGHVAADSGKGVNVEDFHGGEVVGKSEIECQRRRFGATIGGEILSEGEGAWWRPKKHPHAQHSPSCDFPSAS